MNKYKALLLAPIALAMFAAPTLAQTAKMDMSTMTCADMMKMDKTGMMEASQHARMMIKYNDMTDADKKAMDDKSATATKDMSAEDKQAYMMTEMMTEDTAMMDTMTADEKTAAMKTQEDSMMKMEADCKGNDTMLLKDMKM